MATAASRPHSQSDPQPTTHSFCLLLSGIRELNEEVENALFAAGCDDAVLSISDQHASLMFDREADSLVEAVRSAIEDVEQNELGIRVDQVMLPGEDAVALVNAYLALRRAAPAAMETTIREALFRKLLERHGHTS